MRAGPASQSVFHHRCPWASRVSRLPNMRGRSRETMPCASSSDWHSSGGGTTGGAVSIRSTPSRSRANVALTSSPGPGIVLEDNCARTCAAAPPWRSTSTRTSSGPAGTGEQKCVFAESGRSPGSASSCCIARIATVISAPPDGVRKSQACGRSAVYQPGATVSLVTAVSRARSPGVMKLPLVARWRCEGQVGAGDRRCESSVGGQLPIGRRGCFVPCHSRAKKVKLLAPPV